MICSVQKTTMYSRDIFFIYAGYELIPIKKNSEIAGNYRSSNR